MVPTMPLEKFQWLQVGRSEAQPSYPSQTFGKSLYGHAKPLNWEITIFSTKIPVDTRKTPVGENAGCALVSSRARA